MRNSDCFIEFCYFPSKNPKNSYSKKNENYRELIKKKNYQHLEAIAMEVFSNSLLVIISFQASTTPEHRVILSFAEFVTTPVDLSYSKGGVPFII